MKFKFIITLLAMFAVFFISCDDNADNLGVEIQPPADKILLRADTFHLITETVLVDSIVSKPDSLLLGTFIDDYLGTTRADIFTQLALPTTNFTYLDESTATTTPDSIVVTMNFSSYFGVATSPMEINIYELKKTLLDKDASGNKVNYYSNIDPSLYVDFAKKLNASNDQLTIIDGITGKTHTKLTVKLSDEFLQRFFSKNPQIFKSQTDFLNFFKGLYVTTDFGSSTMVNVQSFSMTLYYHYVYKNDPNQAKIKGYHTFPANSEIIKVNRIQHPFRTLRPTPADEYHYIVSPANYQTKVRIPIARLRKRVKDSLRGKNIDVNSATLNINIREKNQWGSGSLIPYVSNMLLIRESDLDDFFRKHKLPSDTVSFVADLSRIPITSSTYKYFYTFDGLANLIEYEIKKSNNDEYIDMVLVPVSLVQMASSSGTQVVLAEVNQSTQMQAVAINSGRNKDIPMKLEVVFSGF